MSRIFRKEHLTPATFKKRGLANLIDLITFVGYIVLISRGFDFSYIGRIIGIVLFIFIYLPVGYTLGATIGQLVINLRIRKIDDYDSKISLFDAYKRLFLLFANYWIDILSLRKKRKMLYDKLSGTITLELDITSDDKEAIEFQKRGAKFKGIVVCFIYSLWVFWVGNFWLLLGNVVILDIYIFRKVPWDFWKKPKDGSKPKGWVEWVDAIVFALVAVYFINLFLFQNYKIPTSSLEKSLLVGDHLFVSKVTYGPRIPNTPLSFPLLQNMVPGLNIKSYIEWPNWEYKRLKGFKQVEKGDIVVFNFPTGDTVPLLRVNPDYYITCRSLGLERVRNDKSLLKGYESASQYEINTQLKELGKEQVYLNPEYFGDVVYRPVDRRDNYVKRCVAVAGDTFQIKSNQVYINGKMSHNPEGLQHWYEIMTDGTKFNQKFLDKLEISDEDAMMMGIGPVYRLPLTEEKANQLKSYSFIRQMKKSEEQADSSQIFTWPYSSDYVWSRDNFGPLWIPAKGAKVDLTLKNLVLYERIITAYEGNTLVVKNGDIYINEQKTSSYTFKMDYYFMMGDNRHQSADSRYWGFVPEDHVVGRPLLVWLSLNKDKSLFGGKIRWERFFKWVANE